MKKLLAIAILAVLFAVNAYAQNNSTDQGNTEFQANVICPIFVNPDNGPAVNIGNVVPNGQAQTLNNVFAQFEVQGQGGFQFTTTGSLDVTGNYSGSHTGSVTINTFQWKESQLGITYNDANNSGPWTLANVACNADGYFFRCYVTSIKASTDASAGTWTFPVTLTATYVAL